jgi:cysteinyl-tRNA synthetase
MTKWRIWPVIIAVLMLGTACTGGGSDSESASSEGQVSAEGMQTPSGTAESEAGRSSSPARGGVGRSKVPAITVTATPAVPPSGGGSVRTWVYQLQGYPGGRLDALVRTRAQLAVIDLARDAAHDYFTPQEIAALKKSGKRVLAYFEIGSIEDFRPEYAPMKTQSDDLVLNRWNDWPNEYFVRYWDERWWEDAIKPRVDRALAAGFDGVYLDTPLAYENIDLSLVPGQTRESLAVRMVNLIVRISAYAKARRPGFLIFPQNSPELRHYPGYTAAVDGIGMEELFFEATDNPCTEDYCAENLAEARALRDAGKLVLAVDYAGRSSDVRAACARYRSERFAGYVADLELDRIRPACP